MERLGGFLISKIKQTQGRVMNALIVKEEITAFSGEQGGILLMLWKRDGISQSELAKETGLAKNTVTLMLERMEQANLVRRQACPKDKRKIRVYLTDYAHTLKIDYNRISDQMKEIFYKGFSDDEISQFESYLKRISSNLEEELH